MGAPKRQQQDRRIEDLLQQVVDFLLLAQHRPASNTRIVKKTRHPLRSPVLVGTVHDARSLRRARRLARPPTPPNWLEIRLDAIVPPVETWVELSDRPLLLTVRDAEEGGRRCMHLAERRELFLEHLRHAAFVDIEIASLDKLAGVVRKARRSGVGLVASFHDFEGTPDLRKLAALADRALAARASVLKIATTTHTPDQLARLLDFLAREKRIPVSVMGMGQLGRVSRLALAAAGSVLNYVSVGSSAAPGQWPAQQFHRRWQELR
jgi:3-dehydroquinate dehydratase-1